MIIKQTKEGTMQDKVLRKLFLGFMDVHILHYAKKEPFYGVWLIEELKEHGYDVSPGTLYPILHTMEQTSLLLKKEKNYEGKIRKYYQITDKGADILLLAKKKAFELFEEIREDE
jgi:PadR family transcriptional regulator PadR